MTDSDLLCLATLVDRLGLLARRFDIDILARCDSSNAVLLSRAEDGALSGTVVVAEEQTAGRGRRGRHWVSARGDSLTFSLLWRFPLGQSISGLSLAVGVALIKALSTVTEAAVGAPSFQLKWPNDILRDDRKLGGVLIELVPGAPNVAVIGIGLNLRLPVDLPQDVRAGAGDVGAAVDINLLLAEVLGSLAVVLDEFVRTGFASCRTEWLAHHAFQDRPVRLTSDFGPAREGLCRGVDGDGALMLEVDGCIEKFLSGEISLRPAL